MPIAMISKPRMGTEHLIDLPGKPSSKLTLFHRNSFLENRHELARAREQHSI
jgi:hypothetical protein